MRTFYAVGMDKMLVPWAVEGLPSLLHLSVFFFFGGLVIFLFNNDHEVFSYVVWWIGLFSVLYGLITLLPFIRHDSPYNSPLTTPAWFLYTGMLYVTFKGLIFLKARKRRPTETPYVIGWRERPRYYDLRDRYRSWMFGGVERAAEKTALERSSEMDFRILDWTVSTLGDDNSLSNFFESIPGYFDSKMVKHPKRNIPQALRVKLFNALHEFWERSLSSNSISYSEKARRLDISLNAMSRTHDDGVWSIIYNTLFCRLDEMPLTVEMGHVLAPWCTSNNQDIADCARDLVALILAFAEERNDSWLTIATRAFGPLADDVRDSITLGGDSVLLAILIKVVRKSIPANGCYPVFLRSTHALVALSCALSKFDIHNTPQTLQREFCAVWNELVLDSRMPRSHSIPVQILSLIRRPYIVLHQGTDAAPTAFSASTPTGDDIWSKPSSYPFCRLRSHYIPFSRIDFAPRPGDSDNSDADSKAESIVLYKHTSSPTKDITLTETFTYRPEENEQQDGVAQCGKPDASQNLSTVSIPASTSTPAPVTPPVLLVTSAPHDVGGATSSGSSLYTPSAVSSAVTPCYPLLHVPPFPSQRPVALWSTTSPSRPASGLSLSNFRPRGLVNSGNMCFANAVLQLLVHSPPSWNLFRELCKVKEQRGALECPETCGGATPLVDATMRFFEKFTSNESELHSTQHPLQHSPGGVLREGEEKEKNNSVVDSFEPSCLYEALKERRQLKTLLVSSGIYIMSFCH